MAKITLGDIAAEVSALEGIPFACRRKGDGVECRPLRKNTATKIAKRERVVFAHAKSLTRVTRGKNLNAQAAAFKACKGNADFRKCVTEHGGVAAPRVATRAKSVEAAARRQRLRNVTARAYSTPSAAQKAAQARFKAAAKKCKGKPDYRKCVGDELRK